MSCVAYKDGVLAGDSRAYGGDYQSSPGQKAKIHRLPDGSVVGITSAVLGMPERYTEWLRNGADLGKFGEGSPDCCVMMVKPNGDLFIAQDGLYFSGPIKSRFHAIGSGAKYALGAMAVGATAVGAISAACQFDPHCGGEVMTLTVGAD